MKILKHIILWLLALIVMIIFGTLTLKIYDLILKLGYENIWLSGFKVGLAAWTGLLISVYLDKKKKQEEIKNEK